ncbi:MAG: ProQ/FINO family protein [Beijerinckiaceae bacterium]|nr:ProQ/FINO family protein [Beijerinckiaceae bacterium]
MTDTPTTVRALRKFLVETYPLTFCDRGVAKRPLALCVRAGLFEAHADVDQDLLNRTLKDYTGGPTYLRQMRKGADRINLAGSAEGFVTGYQAREAGNRLRKMAEHRPVEEAVV